MSALALSLTPQGVAVVHQDRAHEPVVVEGGDNVTLTRAVYGALDEHVDTFLVCRGPGSFTSVRVVLSLACGLCAARRGWRCFSATAFEILAHEAQYPQDAWMLVYSHQGYFYAQPWCSQAPTGDAVRLTVQNLPQGKLVGTPSPHATTQTTVTRPQACTLMDLYEQNQLCDTTLQPFYVHNPVFCAQSSPCA